MSIGLRVLAFPGFSLMSGSTWWKRREMAFLSLDIHSKSRRAHGALTARTTTLASSTLTQVVVLTVSVLPAAA
jgi:hypothetical protein